MRIKLLTGTLVVLTALAVTGCKEETTSYTQAGMEALSAMDYETATDSFEKALENDENKRLILRGQGLVMMAQLDYGSAIDLFSQALRLSDGVPEDLDFDISYYLASAYYNNDQPQEAISVYNSILTLKASDANAYYLRGVVELETGDANVAQEDFKKAMEIRPDDFDLVIDIYRIMAARGYKEAGRDILSNVIAAHNSMSEYDLGRFNYYLGNYEEARNYLEKAEKGDAAQVTLYLGRAYEALGDYNYAISLYNTYLDKQHSEAEIYNQMGLCQMKMERYSEALSSFQAGMNLDNSSIMQTLKYNEIVAYEYMNEFQTASALMKEYLRMYPNDSVAKREYEFLKTR